MHLSYLKKSDLIRMTFIVTQRAEILTILRTTMIIAMFFFIVYFPCKNAKNFPEIRLHYREYEMNVVYLTSDTVITIIITITTIDPTP